MAQNMSAQDQEMMIGRVRSELQAQAVQELMQKVSEKCFSKCVTKPGSRLENKEQTCLAMCVDRYLDTMNAVVQAVQSRDH